MNDFYLIYFPIGYDFIHTTLSTFKYVPKNANIIVVTNNPQLLKDIKVDFNLIILNLDDLRDEWSKKNEILIYETEPQAYIDKLIHLKENNIKFPYAFHRCILPWLAQNNITKFAILDADCLINYHNEFETVLNYHYETLGDNKVIFGPTMVTPTHKEEFIKLSKDILNKYNIDPNIIENIPPDYICLDGWLRGFWFDNPSDILLFYNLWDEILKESYQKQSVLINQNSHTFSDEWLHGLVSYIFTQISEVTITDPYYTGYRIAKHIYHPENYYYHLHHQLYSCHYELKPSTSRKNFFSENKDKLIKFYKYQNGIEEHRIKEVIHDWNE
jgi:hypothetical protein